MMYPFLISASSIFNDSPQMSPIHFELLEPAFNASGYNLQVLPNDNKQAVDVGLKYVNNDACYPSLIVVGQIMTALTSGKYDLNKTASSPTFKREASNFTDV